MPTAEEIVETLLRAHTRRAIPSVGSSYDDLTALLRQTYSINNMLGMVLEQFNNSPEVWDDGLRDILRQVDLNDDNVAHALAQLKASLRVGRKQGKPHIREIVDHVEPFVRGQQEQQTLVSLLFAGTPIPSRIQYGSASTVFAISMVQSLMDFGEVEPGRPAVVILLEHVRDNVGFDKRDDIQELIDRLQDDDDSDNGDQVGGNQVKGGAGSTNIQQNLGDISGGSVTVIGTQTNISNEPRTASIKREEPLKILFLAANPKDTDPLRLSEEIRTIDEKLRSAHFRERFELEQHWAVRIGDIQEFLLRHNPHVVHFSGHGSHTGEILLEDNVGNSAPVSERALSNLFRILKDNIRCVVLNACWSTSQAEAIAEEIECVVGMTRQISDVAAIQFAGSFYQGLGFARSIQTSFDLATNSIDLNNLNEIDTPQLVTKTGVEAAQVYLITED